MRSNRRSEDVIETQKVGRVALDNLTDDLLILLRVLGRDDGANRKDAQRVRDAECAVRAVLATGEGEAVRLKR